MGTEKGAGKVTASVLSSKFVWPVPSMCVLASSALLSCAQKYRRPCCQVSNGMQNGAFAHSMGPPARHADNSSRDTYVSAALAALQTQRRHASAQMLLDHSALSLLALFQALLL